MIDWNAPAIIALVRQGVILGVTDGIAIVDRYAVRLIQSPPKTGRIYRRRGVSHQASAPKEAPATDQGDLVRNRTVTINARALRGRLTFHSAHAPRLEHGTRRMAPRPFARRSLLENRAAIAATISRHVMDQLR